MAARVMRSAPAYGHRMSGDATADLCSGKDTGRTVWAVSCQEGAIGRPEWQSGTTEGCEFTWSVLVSAVYE